MDIDKILLDTEVKTNHPRNHSTPAALKSCIAANMMNIPSSVNIRKVRPNISPAMRAAVGELIDLQRERVIVIKPSDKAGGFVIMDFDTYKADMDKKMEEKFVDTDSVEKLKYPLSSQEQLKREHELVKKIIEEGRDKGFISEEDARLATPSEPKPGRLYGNPKDHKQCHPG